MIDTTELRERAAEAFADHAHVAIRKDELIRVCDELDRLARLRADINTPHTADFLEAVRSEAIYQRELWGTDHDGGKTDGDWFWLIGYLAGKATRHIPHDKKLHHIITTAAALLNWHAHATGTSTRMRPGIEPPAAHSDGESNAGES